MKLGRNGVSLFPRRLTGVWSGFVDDYVRTHETAHEKMRENMGCPWNTAPKTIDEFIESCEKRKIWEENTKRIAPTMWSCIVTSALLEEIARGVKELKDAKRNP